VLPRRERAETSGRFKPYPAYKDSGVEWLGKIPAHWEVKRLRFVTESNPVPSEVRGLPGETEVSFVPMEAVGEQGGMSIEITKQLAEVKDGYTYFRDGDIVIAKITPCFENGKGALAAGLTNGIAFGTTELHVLRMTERADSRFALYLTFSDPFRKLGEADMYGAGGQKRISESFVRNFSPALPSLAEQRAVAAFLDRETVRIDALVAKKERLIELLGEQRTSLITRAVTKGLDPTVPMKDSGVDWLGEIPAHWEAARMWRISKAISGGTPNKEERGYWDGDIPWVSPKDMKRRFIDSSEDTITDRAVQETGIKLILAPVVLIVVRGMILAHTFPVAITTVSVTINQDMKALQFRQRISPIFAAWLFEGVGNGILGTVVEEAAHGTRVIRMDQWRMVFAVVPPMDEQQAIVDFLDSETARIDTLVVKVRDAVECLKELRTALISAAVTGKIDVREVVP
jgi:type I restriction enzyme S subunit